MLCHAPTPRLPVISPPLSSAYPESHLSSSPLVYANAERKGGSVGGVSRGPAPAPSGPAPHGLLGLWPGGFLSPCVHVTVLGWNVNNKEECPRVQRVPEGREFGYMSAGNLNKSPLAKPKSGGGRVKGGGEPRLEGTLGTKLPTYSIPSGNTLWAA